MHKAFASWLVCLALMKFRQLANTLALFKPHTTRKGLRQKLSGIFGVPPHGQSSYAICYISAKQAKRTKFVTHPRTSALVLSRLNIPGLTVAGEEQVVRR